MITKKHIRQYLDKLSPDIPTRQGEMPDHMWQKLHEYIVKHYKRLDKGARAYADEIFDQLDASVRQRIDSLPEGLEKKVLSRKLSMVRGEHQARSYRTHHSAPPKYLVLLVNLKRLY